MDLDHRVTEALQWAGEEGMKELRASAAGNRRSVLSRVRLRRRNLLLVSTATAVLFAGGVAWAFTFQPQQSIPSGGKSGYFIEMPQDVDDSGDLVASTNLPEGTVISIQVSGGTEGGGGAFAKVRDGKVVLREGRCPEGLQESEILSEFDLTITVRPVLSDQPVHCPLGQDCESLNPAQPQEVLEELGPQFERLRGDQVTRFQGSNQIQVSQRYKLPTCVAR